MVHSMRAEPAGNRKQEQSCSPGQRAGEEASVGFRNDSTGKSSATITSAVQRYRLTGGHRGNKVWHPGCSLRATDCKSNRVPPASGLGKKPAGLRSDSTERRSFAKNTSAVQRYRLTGGHRGNKTCDMQNTSHVGVTASGHTQ